MQQKFEANSIIFYVHGLPMTVLPSLAPYGHLIVTPPQGQTSELTIDVDPQTGKLHVVIRPK
jgi:hypothetical protein